MRRGENPDGISMKLRQFRLHDEKCLERTVSVWVYYFFACLWQQACCHLREVVMLQLITNEYVSYCVALFSC